MMERFKRIQFGSNPMGHDDFVLKIIAGQKTVTLCPAEYYNQSSGEYNDGGWQITDNVEVYDLLGQKRCLIEIIDLKPVNFGEAVNTLWQADGYVSSEAFLQDYHQAWPTVHNNFALIALYFRLIEAYFDYSINS